MRESAIIQTYLDQLLTLPGGETAPTTGFVFGSAMAEGPDDWDALHDRQRRMLESLANRGVQASAGYAVGALLSWVEPVTFAPAMEWEDAKAFAHDWELGYFIGQAEGITTVYNEKGLPLAEAPRCEPIATGVCVMPNPEPGEVCIMPGNVIAPPAIRVALAWKNARCHLIAALGCRTCEEGEVFRMRGSGSATFKGGPIVVFSPRVTTRFTALLEADCG